MLAKSLHLFLTTLVVTILLTLFTHNLFAQAGNLDSTFGYNGEVITYSEIILAYSMAIQADGKIVAAGTNLNFALIRRNINGSIDSTFSDDGAVSTSIGFGGSVANSVLLQPDGKIVAAGYSYNGVNDDFALARYNINGTLDSSFNTD